MSTTSEVANKSFLEELGIDVSTIKFIKPAWKRAHYQAVINWLTKYKAQPNSSALEQVQGYIEVLNNFCELKEWNTIQLVLRKQISINLSVSLPLYEYLLFRQLSRELLVISQDIIDCLQETEHDLTFAVMLKARALSDNSEKLEVSRKLFEELFNNSKEGTEIHIESLTYLGVRQVNSGSYQEGIKSLNEALVKIDSNQEFALNYKIQELKSDILENLALYQMNSRNFQQAIQLYNNVINIRKQLGLLHRVIHPSAHVGILMRKFGKFEQALFYLNEAKKNAEQFDNESQIYWIHHHLAFVHLNQGRYKLAEELCNSSLENYKKSENRWGESDCYEQLGLIDLAMKRYDNAEINFKKALTVRQYIGNLHGTATSILDLALASWHKRKFMKAIYYLLKGFYLYYKLEILNLTRFRRLLKLAFIWTLGNKKSAK